MRGQKTTSAQITSNYAAGDFIDELVIAVMNFPPKRVAGVKSEVLVLAVVDDSNGTVLLRPERDVQAGARVPSPQGSLMRSVGGHVR